MAERLGVRLLGEFLLDGADLTTLRSRQARTLLKRLAVAQGTSVDPDALVDAVWPDARPAQPDRDLHVLVSRARAAVGVERVTRSDAGYALAADWWDVDELRTLAAEATRRADEGDLMGARTAADGALALVRGDLLADEPDAAWCEAPRAEARRTLSTVLEVAATAALATGQLGSAVAHAERALRLDGYDEGALRTLMRAHAAAGRPAAALAEFARVGERLAEELGVDPAPETRAVHEAILREDPFRSGGEPAPPLPGRTRQLDVLDEELRRAMHETRIVLVTAGPGAGKTALLDHWAAAAESGGAVVLRGHGEPGGMGLQPVVDALTGGGADLDPNSWALSGGLPGPGATSDALTEAVFGRLDDAVRSLPAAAGWALVLDDADHLDPLSWSWVARLHRRSSVPLLVVLAARVEAVPLTPDVTIRVQPLHEPPEMVSPDRWRDLPGAETTLQAAAVIGTAVDLELLAAVLDRPALEVLEHLDAVLDAGLLAEREGRLVFGQEPAREALAGGTSLARRAWLHRRAAEVLGARPGANPLELARHAREGGDRVLAATALARAADVARTRLDLVGAQALLDEAIALDDRTGLRLQRSRLRMARGDLDGADADAEAAMAGDDTGEALELRAWAARNRHDLGGAVRLGEAAAARAVDPAIRSSSLIAVAFGHRGTGDLARADEVLRSAAGGPDELGLPAWTGVLRVHQGRPTEALATLEPTLGVDARRGVQGFWVEHTLQMTAHAYGLLGRSADSLRVIDRLEQELDRRGTAVRYAGVQHTYRSWILRNLGDPSAEEVALAGLELAGSQEILAQCHLDVADCLLRTGDLEAAESRLAVAATESGTRWFHNKWRFDQRRLLLVARLALAHHDAAGAIESAESVMEAASGRGDDRYRVLARLVHATASGQPADGADLDRLAEVAALEGWWLAADVADATSDDHARDVAQRLAEQLVRDAGRHADTLRRAVAARLG